MKEDLDKIARDIKRLRTEYEKYFVGTERLEPQRLRGQIKQQLRRLQALTGHNTAFKFRAQSLQQTLLTHEQYWNRITRQIEEGTYRRHVERAERQQKAKRQASENTPRETPRPAKRATAGSAKLETLHQAYGRARSDLGLDPVSLKALARTVEKQTAALKKRFNCQAVDFRVAVKDGKPILKATPR